MKNKSAKLAIILFIGVNTLFIWEQVNPTLSYLLFMIFSFVAIILFFLCILKIGGLLIDKFKSRNNNISVGIIGFVLAFCFFYPYGIIRSSDFESEYFLKASRIGTANCSTTIKLEYDKSFTEMTRCFGIEKNEGTYDIKNDTIYFTFKNNSDVESKRTYGLLKLKDDITNDNYGNLIYYENIDDNKPIKYSINKLNKQIE